MIRIGLVQFQCFREPQEGGKGITIVQLPHGNADMELDELDSPTLGQVFLLGERFSEPSVVNDHGDEQGESQGARRN